MGQDTYPDWEAIYRDNVERIYRLIYTKVGNRADAEDLTTEVFLAALGPLRASATTRAVRTYLFATARTVLASHWRRTLGRQVTTVDDVDLAGIPAEPLAEDPTNSSAARRAAEILAALPPRYRDILRLRFIEGYSIRQAAAELRVSIGNAKVLQHRALRQAAAVQSGEGTVP